MIVVITDATEKSCKDIRLTLHNLSLLPAYQRQQHHPVVRSKKNLAGEKRLLQNRKDKIKIGNTEKTAARAIISPGEYVVKLALRLVAIGLSIHHKARRE